MLNAVFRGLGDLRDPAIALPLLRIVGLTVGLFAVLGWLTARMLLLLPTFGWTWMEEAVSGFAERGFLSASVALGVPVAALAVPFLIDGVAAAVERRHYAHVPPADPVPWLDAALAAVLLFGRMAGLNLVLLVAWLLLPGWAGAGLFYIANGYLLGREYFELVGLRRTRRREVVALRRQNRLGIVAAGTLIAVLLTVPVVNIAVPALATAVMVHLYWQAAQAPAST